MRDRLTKKQAYSTGNNNDIIDYWIWETGIDPDTLTQEQYHNFRMKCLCNPNICYTLKN
jgi:hypothetical protein